MTTEVKEIKKQRVLVIDDKCIDLSYHELLPGLCEGFPGIEWCEFKDIRSGDEAIDMIEAHRPDVVILDGNICGRFLGPRLAAYCQHDHPEILVIANSGDDGKIHLWREAGVVHFTEKNPHKIKTCLAGICTCAVS